VNAAKRLRGVITFCSTSACTRREQPGTVLIEHSRRTKNVPPSHSGFSHGVARYSRDVRGRTRASLQGRETFERPHLRLPCHWDWPSRAPAILLTSSSISYTNRVLERIVAPKAIGPFDHSFIFQSLVRSTWGRHVGIKLLTTLHVLVQY